jgi:hypothetical protein
VASVSAFRDPEHYESRRWVIRLAGWLKAMYARLEDNDPLLVKGRTYFTETKVGEHGDS